MVVAQLNPFVANVTLALFPLPETEVCDNEAPDKLNPLLVEPLSVCNVVEADTTNCRSAPELAVVNEVVEAENWVQPD